MDQEIREMQRRRSSEFVSSEELISKRTRSGLCAICANTYSEYCPCIGTYFYAGENSRFYLRRNKRSTLPIGVVTGVTRQALIVLIFAAGGAWRREENTDFTTKDNGEIEICFNKIADIEIAVLHGIDIDEDEKRRMSGYIDALEEASDF